MNNSEQSNNPVEGQTPEFSARVAAAFNGKDGRQILHAIKYIFPYLKTGELNIRIMMLQAGRVTDVEILQAIETL